MKRFINRLPLLLFILTLVSLVLMIAVRIVASGTKLLSMSSGAGRLAAAYYHPSVVVFIIILVLFMAVILTVRLKQYHRKKREIAENAAFTPGEVEYPPSTVISMEQIEAGEDDSPVPETETENAEEPEDIGTAAAEQDEKTDAEAPAAFEEEAGITLEDDAPPAFEEEMVTGPEAETPENLENQD